ncbi:HEPN domain-containing protein [Anabaena sp. CCY 0017]|uniref:HEPN domain-containing protein n=1 Tax=Anabaena sp. CCY 0017 TaxID=3103866 RepID=UPI0039C5D0B3
MKEEFIYTLDNLWRAKRLIELSKKIEADEIRNDLLGCGVVFLHATLEEFLRCIALKQWFLLADESLKIVLKRYPRLNSRNIKVSLLELVDKRPHNIESLIEEEVRCFLYQDMNFNSLDEVEKFLDLINISVKKFAEEKGKEHCDNIESLIRKRHLVAHQANCSQLDYEQILVLGKSLQIFIFYLGNDLGLNVEFNEQLKSISFKPGENALPVASNP